MPDIWWNQEIGPRIIIETPEFGCVILVKVEAFQEWGGQLINTFAILELDGSPSKIIIDPDRYLEINSFYQKEVIKSRSSEGAKKEKRLDLPDISGVSEYTITLRRLFP